MKKALFLSSLFLTLESVCLGQETFHVNVSSSSLYYSQVFGKPLLFNGISTDVGFHYKQLWIYGGFTYYASSSFDGQMTGTTLNTPTPQTFSIPVTYIDHPIMESIHLQYPLLRNKIRIGKLFLTAGYSSCQHFAVMNNYWAARSLYPVSDYAIPTDASGTTSTIDLGLSFYFKIKGLPVFIEATDNLFAGNKQDLESQSIYYSSCFNVHVGLYFPTKKDYSGIAIQKLTY